jgi:hypothetical protein
MTVAAAGAGILGVVAAGLVLPQVRSDGTDLVEDSHDAVVTHFQDEIEAAALDRLSVDAHRVKTEFIMSGKPGDSYVDSPERYDVDVIVIGQSSAGMIEGASIDIRDLEYDTGTVSGEFFYDQVSELDQSGDSVTVRLASGTTYSWASADVPKSAISELQHRIRRAR